tara:strand:- start:439 stop:1431 length:993 start_codon:yes stop_codon:yes gene_type:complete
MRRVLHIGPCDTPGGMAKVMNILAEHPPEGWKADSLSTHKIGNPVTKWLAYRKAMKEFKKILLSKNNCIDLVHVHTAADWSWWRKKQFVTLAKNFSIPCIIHIHSGKFESWMKSPDSKRAKKIRTIINETNSSIVVLSNEWKKRLQPYIGHSYVIHNPVDPSIVHNKDIKREQNQILLLGRNDVVKGHDFAIQLSENLVNSIPDLKLIMTGLDKSTQPWIKARGWVSELEKLELLQKSSLLIVPSAYEGQPLTILEALACGLPCLASDKIIGLPDIVEYAEFENILDWTDKVKNMLMGKINVKDLISASKPYDVTNITNEWKRIYDNMFD